MTSPADHQAGLQALPTGQKDRPHPEANPQPVLIKPIKPVHLKNTAANAEARKILSHHLAAKPTRATAMVIKTPAALPAVPEKRKHLSQKAGRIPVARQITTDPKEALANHQAKRKHLPHAAGHIQAGLQITTKDPRKVLAVTEQVIKNRSTPAANQQKAHHLVATALKEVLVVIQPATKNHSSHAVNRVKARHLVATALKEVLAAIQPVIKSLSSRAENQAKALHLVATDQKEAQAAKEQAGQLQAAVLKSAKLINLMIATGRNAPDHHMIK